MGYQCDWMPDWSDKPVAIIASGPSAGDARLGLLAGRAHTIAINNSWHLYPSAEMLFGCDYEWWKNYNAVPEFHGLKVTSDNRAWHCGNPRLPCDIKYAKRVRVDTLLTRQKGVIGWGGNSGFQAVNIAVHTGAKKIILIGFDMTLKHGLHWHGRHEGRLHNPATGHVDRWRRVMDKAYSQLSKLGISAYNCSSVSGLVAYPKVSLEEALEVPHYNSLRSQVGGRIHAVTRLDIAKKCAAVST